MKTTIITTFLMIMTVSAFSAETYVGLTPEGHRCEMSVTTLEEGLLQLEIPVEHRILMLSMMTSDHSKKTKSISHFEIYPYRNKTTDIIEVHMVGGKPESYKVLTKTKNKEQVWMIQEKPTRTEVHFPVSLVHLQALLGIPNVKIMKTKAECAF